MKEMLARFFVNIAAVFFLSLLLLGPVAFSASFVTFPKDSGLIVSQEDARFGDFLRIKKEKKEISQYRFDLTFNAFPGKQASYQDIIKLKNDSDRFQKIEIVNNQPSQAIVYFDQSESLQKYAQVITLSPGSAASIDLLVMPSSSPKTEIKTFSFILQVE